MTDNPSTLEDTTASAAEKRQADYDSLTNNGSGIKTGGVRARGSFNRASRNPVDYSAQTPVAKLLINLLLMMSQLIDPDNKDHDKLMSMFGKAFGFEDDENHTKFRALRDNVEQRGREAVREELNYGRFNRRAASDTLRMGEKQLVPSATGKNIYNSPLLEMIGQHESGNKKEANSGDYNRLYVPPNMPGYNGVRRVDLSNMTVDEVIQLQRKWVNDQAAAGIPADRRSSALGKYQFIRTTLEATVKQMGISRDEKFTPELQDKLAMHQLKNAGYDKFVAGKTNDHTFLNKVASIWSSIPKTNGRSAHEGIGINAAGTTVAKAVSTLQAERAAIQTAAAKPPETKMEAPAQAFSVASAGAPKPPETNTPIIIAGNKAAATKPETTTQAFSAASAGAPQPPATNTPIIVADNNNDKPAQDDVLTAYKARLQTAALSPT